MRENAYIILAALCIIALMVIIGIVDSKPPVVDATAKMVDCDPAFFADKYIRIKTSHMEIGSNDKELVYRKHTKAPVSLICHMRNPITTIPAFIRGKTVAKQNDTDTTIVTDCVPVD